ncbi:MAG: flavodoxin domain-containing protein [Acetobacterium sp.]|nr:flavodoxin domain-containing protein [Acetobacterium sp.]
MKTMILYASTYGFTRDCAQKLKQNLNGETILIDINKDPIPALDNFDTVLIGGSIYIGQIQKKIKKYCLSHLDELKNKKLGFFISCGSAETVDTYFKNSFPEILLEKALSIQNFGGEMRPDQMNFFHKFISNMVDKSADKQAAPPMKPLPENIIQMSNVMNNLS